MAIPGLKTKYEVRGKVRIGEKRTASSGRSYPAATDYFVSDDAEFNSFYNSGTPAGGRPNTIEIVMPHADVEDCFSSGLEWWTKSAKATKSTLACYTKGDGTALRKDGMLDPDDKVLGPAVGQGRLPIVCRFRECPQFGHNCKPMARLSFFLWRGQTTSVLNIDTKSWNTIERLTAALQGARMKGPLTGRVFALSVAFETKGANRFPVLSLKEIDVQINNETDVSIAEGYIAIERAKDRGGDERMQLAAYLNEVRPGWRDDEELVAKIQRVGVSEALAKVRAQASA